MTSERWLKSRCVNLFEAKVQGEIDADEARLAEQQQEFENLQSQDSEQKNGNLG